MSQLVPLNEVHKQLGAKMVEFGGWMMPLLYNSIVEEHLATRQAAGLFDISHMGEFVVSGAGAADFLNYCLTNDVRRLAVGQGQYTLLCNERGGVVDDLYVFRVRPQEFLLVVNAARIDADWEWLETLVDRCPAMDGFRLRNESADFAAFALQGPRSREILAKVLPGGSIGGALVTEVVQLRKNQWAGFVLEGEPLGVSCTGYTGEDGFELLMRPPLAEALWRRLLDAGRPFGLKPAGLGARDTLRAEMGYPLYGHELDEETTPLEAGLKYFVAFDKGPFVGREVLERQRAAGVSRKAIAFKMLEKGPPPRSGCPICRVDRPDETLGKVTSGVFSPSLKIGIGMGYVRSDCARLSERVGVRIRDRAAPAEIVSKPIYRPPEAPCKS